MIISLIVHLTMVWGASAAPEDMEVLKDILLVCRGPEDPMPNDEIAEYARLSGLSDAAVSDMLIELAQAGLNGNSDAMQRQLAEGALWGLARFGSERGNQYVRELMLATQDTGIRQVCIRVGIRMMPEKWEEWLRLAADSRFDDLTRFNAYEEAYRVGQGGDDNTRQRVEKVLSEFVSMESTSGNDMNLRQWTSDLKAH